MWKKMLLGAVVAAGAVHVQAASVAIVTSAGSLEGTGVTFSANLNYDETTQKLVIQLSNTSGFQSVITGFAFNIDNDNASASYAPTDFGGSAGVDESAFAFDGSSFTGPYGNFDAGVLLQDLSVQQVKGIDEGETGLFEFDIFGSAAGALTAADFATQINDGSGSNDAAFIVRYQSVGPNAELSDRAFSGPPTNGPGPTPVIPLPPAAWSGLVVLAGMGASKLRRRKA